MKLYEKIGGYHLGTTHLFTTAWRSQSVRSVAPLVPAVLLGPTRLIVALTSKIPNLAITSTGIASFLFLLGEDMLPQPKRIKEPWSIFYDHVKERAMYFLILRICTGTTALFRSPP